MNRKLNNKLNITKPDADSSEVSHPRKCQSFEIDEEVWVREIWIPGSILALTSPVSYQVSTEIGNILIHS